MGEKCTEVGVIYEMHKRSRWRSKLPRATHWVGLAAIVCAALLATGCGTEPPAAQTEDVAGTDADAGLGAGVDGAVSDATIDTSELDGGIGSTDSEVSDALTSSQDTKVDGGGPVVANMPALCAVIAQQACAPVGGCCAGAKLRFDSVATCATALESACVTAAGQELALIAAGEATFDVALASSCAQHYANATQQCDTISAAAAATTCKQTITAKAVIGGTCPKGTDGMRCGPNASGLCFPEPTGTSCKAIAKVGQPCKEAPCTGFSQGSPLLCMPPATGTGDNVCDTARGKGAPCKATVHCDGNHWCSAGTCTPRKTNGGACTKALHCQATLHCDPFTETCAPVKAKGGACYQHSACGGGLRCLGTGVGKVCMMGQPTDGKPGGATLGQPCTGGCGTGLVCADGPLAGACAPAACAALAATGG